MRLFLLFFLSTGFGFVQSQDYSFEVLADGLSAPWNMEWLDDDQLIFSERGGQIKVLNLQTNSIHLLYTFPDVAQEIQSGLMGITCAHPTDQNPVVYAMYTVYSADFSLMTLLVSLDYNPERQILENKKIILDSIPCQSSNLGGRLIHDGQYLWVSVGDADRGMYAQDMTKWNGKILRIHPDGRIPVDNPFPNSPVWSLGHRNPQGLVQTPFGIYASEHGSFVNDEINRIEMGQNYGWPKTSGNDGDATFHPADWVWKNTIAPSGIDYCDGCLGNEKKYLLVASLKGKQVEALEVGDQGQIIQSRILVDQTLGRIRDILVGSEGALYVCTSNQDIYSSSKQADRIIKLQATWHD